MADTTKTFSFNTFGGADTSIFLMFGKDTSGGKQTIQVGNIAAIQGVIKVEGAPRYVMGEADPQGFSSGKRLISGSVVLESLNRAFITEINEILDPEFKLNYQVGGSPTELTKMFYKYADQLPKFDIVITLTKKDNPNQRAQRTLIGCKFMSESSGIGLSTLDIQEQLSFMARDITPLKKITVSV